MSIHDDVPPTLSTQPPSPPRVQLDYCEEILAALSSEHGTPPGIFDFLIPQILRSFDTCGQIPEHDLWIVAHGANDPDDADEQAIFVRWHLCTMVFEAALSNEDEHGVDYGIPPGMVDERIH